MNDFIKIQDSKIESLEEELLSSFLSHFESYQNVDKEKVKILFKEIFKLHKSKDRYYHGLKHLKHIYAFLLERIIKINDIKVLIMATLFHDAIYNSENKTNEKDSADLASKKLTEIGFDSIFIGAVVKIILATEKHSPENIDYDELIFLDADLLILSTPNQVYDTYASNIRKEYSWVSEADYKEGRRKVLEKFLERDKIYFSEEMQDFELKAKSNIIRELEILK